MPRSFKLLETLGEGAFGAVHLAEVEGDEGFVQRLAVKWLHAQWSHDAELAGRLRDEARLLALLNHEHIVRVHGLTRFGGRLAILMEPVDGVDLSRLGGERVPARAAIEIAAAVADALEAAWKTIPPGGTEPLRVVHRDIKPSNIMVTMRGGLKVMDFGVARASFEAREAQTRSQQYGTARYMAPERWLHGTTDAPSDVFSLGITLVELLSGAAFERPRLSEQGFREDLARALEPLSEWPKIRELVERMCSYDPTLRPAAGEVADVCRAISGALPAPGLRDWAATWIARSPARAKLGPGDGTILEEEVSGESMDRRSGKNAVPRTTPLPSPSARIAGPNEDGSHSVNWRLIVVVAAITALGMTGWQYVRAMRSMPAVAEVAVEAVQPQPELAEPIATLAEPVEPTDAPDEQTSGESTPAPQPSETPPRIRPKPVESPGTAAGEVENTESAPVVETVVVKFVFDPPYAVELAPGGPVRSQHGVALAKGQAVQVRVTGEGRSFQCTITADPSKRTVRIDGKHEVCSTR